MHTGQKCRRRIVHYSRVTYKLLINYSTPIQRYNRKFSDVYTKDGAEGGSSVYSLVMYIIKLKKPISMPLKAKM